MTYTPRTVALGLTFDDVLLVPKLSCLSSRQKADVSTRITPTVQLGIPIISANMDTVTGRDMAWHMAQLGGLGVLHRFATIDDQAEDVRFLRGAVPDMPVAAAIGVRGPELERAAALVAAGVSVLVLDIAHGHSKHCLEMIEKVKAKFPDVPLIAGNVATYDGARDLAQAGADGVKCGVGPGALCTTRVVTGFGVPQLTAVDACCAGMSAVKEPYVIADGGIRNSGDIVKALAMGACAVMIGSLFAGADESPGEVVRRGGQRYKVVRGMASSAAMLDRLKLEGEATAESQIDWKKVVPEGVEAVVPAIGSIHDLVDRLVGGIRSGLSYGGAHTIKELQQNAEFIRITEAGRIESAPHDVTLGIDWE